MIKKGFVCCIEPGTRADSDSCKKGRGAVSRILWNKPEFAGLLKISPVAAQAHPLACTADAAFAQN